MMFEFSPLVEKALRSSASWHRDQFRKGSNIPYVTHPVAVAFLLKDHGIEDETAIAAALLHDVVEDTDCTLEELRSHFPREVVDIVADMTEKKYDENGLKRKWKERKEEHAQEIANAGKLSRTVFLADKLHNLSTMAFDLDAGEEVWQRFGVSPEKLIASYRRFLKRVECEDETMMELSRKCFRLLDRLSAML